MPDLKLQNHEEIRRAFAENERDVWIRNFRAASILAFIFMPAGSSLDWFVYRPKFVEFFELRLVCSAFLLFIWWFVTTPLGARHYRILGWILPALPTFFISLMIYKTTGAESPYYAGLNLVLLGAAIILRWTLLDSLIVFLEVMLLYLAACFFSKAPLTDPHNSFFNNVYFLFVTGVFVVIGSHFYNLLRCREFAFRYELDKSKREVETSNAKLAEQNIALNRANREIKETEMQLVQSEKLASLGRMSAGMIHEINNPLTFATTGLFTLRKKGKYLAPEQQADYAEILKDVEEGVSRVKTIVSDLRMFTHPDTEQRDRVAVGEVVAAALRFLNNEGKDKVQFEMDLPAGQTIWANKNMLIHVLTNLLQNSLDALHTKTFTDEKPAVRIAGRMEDGVSFLTVHDNGPGIAAEHLDKIYDPFFTTKDVGEGMGLGLSISYRCLLYTPDAADD